MAKNIRPPATAEQIQRAIGVTQEDREIVGRILREIGVYDDPPRERPSSESCQSAKKDE
jgi:hypothetical protein